MQMRIANKKHIVTASTAHEYMRIWNAMRMSGVAKHANATNSHAARSPVPAHHRISGDDQRT